MADISFNSVPADHSRVTTKNLIGLLLLLILLSACEKKESAMRYKNYVDTTVSVYGPYAAIKLPITKGVKIANPLQVALGPQGVLYASNQTGEVYSLQDTDN